MTDTIILETERLRLASWGESAFAEIFALHSDPDVARYMSPDGVPWSAEKVAQKLASWRQEHVEHQLGKLRLTRKSDGLFIGRAGFSFYQGVPEIGYALLPAHWGQGYATEIAAGMRDWFWAEKPNDHFVGFTHIDNLGSQHVLTKIGMQPTHQAIDNDMLCQFFILHRPAS